MSWEHLLQDSDERIVLPWFGGSRVMTKTRVLRIDGKRPQRGAIGWYEWKLKARTVELIGPAEPQLELLSDRYVVTGYLVGDHIAPDGMPATIGLDQIAERCQRVYMIEPGIERFSRVSASKVSIEDDLIFRSLEFPAGPEDEVRFAYLNRATSIDDVKGVTPALDVAFKLEAFHRAEADRVRAELERKQREEEAKLAVEARQRELVRKLGDGASRREMARVDFLAAARAALTVGGADLLDWRPGAHQREYVVTYRVDDEWLQCVVDETLHVIDAGICLTDHATGRKGDTLLTLESIPSVIREAVRSRKLVKWRHPEGAPNRDHDPDDDDW